MSRDVYDWADVPMRVRSGGLRFIPSQDRIRNTTRVHSLPTGDPRRDFGVAVLATKTLRGELVWICVLILLLVTFADSEFDFMYRGF